MGYSEILLLCEYPFIEKHIVEKHIVEKQFITHRM